MTPKTSAKREAENGEEVEACKRVKGDQVKTTEDKHESDTKEHENNNNNDTTSEEEPSKTATNGKTSSERAKVESADKSNGSEKDDADKNKRENGGDESKTDAKVETTTKPEAESETKTSTSERSPSSEEEPAGTLLFCGGANWDMTGRKELPKNAKKPATQNPAARNIWGPIRVTHKDSDEVIRVKGVFSGCNACHSVIVTEEGSAMTFGRNDKGQLGLGDTETKTSPVFVEALKGLNIVAAACGRSHTLFLDSNGIVYACGDNKMGQCGTNQQSVHTITTPVRIAFKENKPVVKLACGAEFSMIVDIDGRLYSFGHPEHGQLGHNSEGKYFTTGNKYAFHCEYAPRRIVTWIEKSREGHVSPVDDVYITDIACGTNHALAVDKKHRCFSWGFAGYHRLGHSETKNELVPRSIRVFDAPPSSGRGAVKVFAGGSHSMALDMNGLLYFWGQNKSSGEATMYPKNVTDLCGWKIQSVSCAFRSIFVVADESCISWGPSPTYGELGYGEGKSKSSTVPQEVRSLDGVRVMTVACGYGHTLLIAKDSEDADKGSLKKLETWP